MIDSVAPKLAPLIRLLSSDKDGEVVAAARAIGRTLSRSGLTFHDLADALSASPAPAPAEWRGRVDWCLARANVLAERDVRFLRGLARWRSPTLTAAQAKWLADIIDKIEARVAA